MDILKAKKIVIQAGKSLIKTGLIARTWGNVSYRINEEQYVITPSGRAYETLTPDEIVTVNIEDCSYEGDVEPSSEKGVHSEVYKQRKDVNFVIHTHQPYASAVSPLKIDIDILDPVAKALIGNKAVSVPYGLSGTKKLRNNVARAISQSKGKAYLMVSHGALCLGKDSDEAFRVAALLEQVCADFINRRYLELSGKENVDPEELRDFFVKEQVGGGTSEGAIGIFNKYYNSERINSGFKLYLDPTEENPFSEGSGRMLKISLDKASPETRGEKLSPGAEIHRAIYLRFEEVQAVIHAVSPDIFTVSQTGKTVYPLLDDFAQIIGTSVRSIDTGPLGDPDRVASGISRKMKGRSSVMIKDNGALCSGPTKSDAAAAAMIMEKNCKAVIVSGLFGQGKPINTLECMLMRYIYLKRYSKKATLK